MSLWQFAAAIGGFSKANGAETGPDFTREDIAGAARALKNLPAWMVN
jgi:hypothetical protein